MRCGIIMVFCTHVHALSRLLTHTFSHIPTLFCFFSVSFSQFSVCVCVFPPILIYTHTLFLSFTLSFIHACMHARTHTHKHTQTKNYTTTNRTTPTGRELDEAKIGVDKPQRVSNLTQTVLLASQARPNQPQEV